MITTTDIANILYKECKAFGIPIYQNGNIPMGEIKEPRITIHVKQMTTEDYWHKGFAEVNISVPNIEDKADLITLQSYERMAWQLFERHSAEYDDTRYRISTEGIEVLEDGDFKCHYVNVRVLYEVLNVK